MKNLLGYLNQSEWIYSLNIGNIMQIAPLTMQDFMSVASIELELSREYVLEKVREKWLTSLLDVLPSCVLLLYGHRIPFSAPTPGNAGRAHILQKRLVSIYNNLSVNNSEYWHGKAVEIAISFLPSESPLVSHILMSYEKHHSPSN